MNWFRLPLFLLLATLTLTLSSCDAIGTIFEAGAWTGIIGLVLVLALVLFIVNRMRRR